MKEVRIGDLEFFLDGADLRYVRLGGREIIRRLHVAVRDLSWATIPGKLSREISDDDGTFRLTWASNHLPFGVPVACTGSIEVSESGLALAVHYRALGPVVYNRIGICVLHPLVQAGCPVEFETPEGHHISDSFPVSVAPQPVVDGGPIPTLGPYRRLTVKDEELTLTYEFEGDDFELEDHRNWTDASLKTYSTPLALPRPRHLRKGDEIAQRVTLSWEGTPSPAQPPMAAKGVRPKLFALLAASPDDVPTTTDLGALVDAGFGLRVQVRIDDADSLADAQFVVSLARQVNARVQLCLMAEESSDWEAARSIIRIAEPEVVFVMHAGAVSGAPNECTDVGLMGRATRELPGVNLAGGTPFNLCELQRHDLRHLPAVCFSICPRVHAYDDASIMETLEALPHVLQAVRKLNDGDIHAGPLLAEERTGSSIGTESMSPRGADILPLEWLAGVPNGLAGATSLCTLDARQLVQDGHLTRAACSLLGRQCD